MFSGVGAEAFGGRFNSLGNKMVYTSESLSLGILELVVQTNKKERLQNLVYATASFDADQVIAIEHAKLSDNWDARPVKSESQLFGDRWLDEQASLVLRVPSVVVPGEFNYLINPEHPDFHTVEFGAINPIEMDSRLSK